MTVHQSRTISVSIDRDWRGVYEFASVPENFPRWAAGLGRRFERVSRLGRSEPSTSLGEEWTAEDPDGRPIRIRFSPPNEFGVLDHVVLAGGSETSNAMRIVQNGTGAEAMFTLLRTPEMTETAFAADAAAVERDLKALKALLER
jgi:hypothetical protein